MFRIILGIALLAHGIGHVIGVSAAWTPVKMGFSDQPWLFSSGVNITTSIGRVFGVVWLAALVINIMAGAGLLLRLEWWVPMAILGALISSAALVIWWQAFPSGSNISALVFNILLIAGLLGPWADRVIAALR